MEKVTLSYSTIIRSKNRKGAHFIGRFRKDTLHISSVENLDERMDFFWDIPQDILASYSIEVK
jgi:hypothetical protein